MSEDSRRSQSVYLFLVLSVPAACVALLSLQEARHRWPGLVRLAQGAAVALPSLLVPAILSAALPAGYRPFPHYLRLAATDHLALHAAATAWWVAIRSYRALEDEAGRRRWDEFLSFSCGFYTLAAFALMVGQWREPDAYAAVMLPVLRLAVIVLSCVLMIVYFESYGLFRFVYAAGYVALPLAAGVATWLERTHHAAGAWTAAAALAALAAFAWWQRERF